MALTVGWCLVVPVFIYFLPVILFHWMMKPAEFEPEWRAYKREKRLKRQRWRAELMEKRRRLVDLREKKKAVFSTVKADVEKSHEKVMKKS